MDDLWNEWVLKWCEKLKWNVSSGNIVGVSDNVVDKMKNNGAVNPDESQYYSFYKTLYHSYTDAHSKMYKNKRNNTRLKWGFVITLGIMLVVQIVLAINYICYIKHILGEDAIKEFIQLEQNYGEDVIQRVLQAKGSVGVLGKEGIQSIVFTEALFLLIMFFVALIISKILDIKKYQETWSRHRRFQYLRQQEMLRFIMDIGDYDGSNGKDIEKFIENMMRIEEQNINKFCENMENKEKGMIDELKFVLNKMKSEGD